LEGDGVLAPPPLQPGEGKVGTKLLLSYSLRGRSNGLLKLQEKNHTRMGRNRECQAVTVYAAKNTFYREGNQVGGQK